MEKNPTSVRFPAAERSWLEEQAQRSGLSVSDVVRLSIRHAMASGPLVAVSSESGKADRRCDCESEALRDDNKMKTGRIHEGGF